MYRHPGYAVSSNGFDFGDIAAKVRTFGEPAFGPYYQGFGGMTVPPTPLVIHYKFQNSGTEGGPNTQ